MSFYEELQSIAGKVLAEFDQGGLSKIEITTTPAANEWELPTNSRIKRHSKRRSGAGCRGHADARKWDAGYCQGCFKRLSARD